MRKASSVLVPVISVNRKSSQPLHKQIYDAYRSLISSGSLRPGQQIPSSRAQAFELKASRIPVLTAYAQLQAEGYFETRNGAGTFVSASLPDQRTPPVRRPGAATPSRTSSRQISRRASFLAPYKTVPWLRGLGAFNLSQPAYDYFPFRVWTSLVVRHSRNPLARALHYGGPLGSEVLREAICTYLRTARAVRCEPSQVMIVSGSQQALELTARVLLDAGDPAWMEEPGYWLTRQVLRAAGCKLIPVPVDNDGLDVAAGIRKCRRAKAAYITPSHQFPTGVTMSAARRLQLLDWAERSGAWIVEDDYDSEYRYGSMPIASLQGLDRNARVIYIGTFSKTLFPALRVGYLVIPQDLVARFAAVRNAMDLGPAHLYQAVLTDFIAEGHYARHIRRMRLLYEERRTALVDGLRKHFDSGLEILGAEAGMHLSIAVHGRVRDVEIAERAAREKLWLVPLSSAYLEKPVRQGFILGFAGTTAAEMPGSIRRLKETLPPT